MTMQNSIDGEDHKPLFMLLRALAWLSPTFVTNFLKPTSYIAILDYMTTHHITLLTEHSFFQTLWRHPLEGNQNRTVAVLPEVCLVAHIFSQTKVRYFDAAITINPGLEIGTCMYQCLPVLYLLRSMYSEPSYPYMQFLAARSL